MVFCLVTPPRGIEVRPQVLRSRVNQVATNVAVFGDHEPNTLEQLDDVASRAEHAALMADGHRRLRHADRRRRGLSQPGVGRRRRLRHRLRQRRDPHRPHAAGHARTRRSRCDDARRRDPGHRVASASAARIARTMRRSDHPLFEIARLGRAAAPHREALRSKARAQLGTVGSGNHYVDVFADESGRDLGRRAFRQPRLRPHGRVGLPRARRRAQKWGARVPEREVLLLARQPLGEDYWALMTLAGEYAYAGREWVARKVVVDPRRPRARARAQPSQLRVARGARRREARSSCARARRRRFPGRRASSAARWATTRSSCGARRTGRRRWRRAQRDALYSTVHGAGRVMSRTAAAGKRNRRTGEVHQPGRGLAGDDAAWVRDKGVILRGGGLDESPHVYRRLPEVLAARAARSRSCTLSGR